MTRTGQGLGARLAFATSETLLPASLDYGGQPVPLCLQLGCCGVSSSQCTSPRGKPTPSEICSGCAPTGRAMPPIMVWRVGALTQTTGVARCDGAAASGGTTRYVWVAR